MKTLDKDIIDSIETMIAKGHRLELPDGHMANYAQVKRVLIKAGGKYSKCGFTFPGDAAEVKARLTGGEIIDDKKKFQFFATPPELARKMVTMADIRPMMTVLEPSAGHGSILDELPTGCFSMAAELNLDNAKVLRDKGIPTVEGDFLKMRIGTDFGDRFDRIVANPPFTRNQDIDHVRHMYDMLDDGGRMVSIMSTSWTFGSQKKQIAFREWLDEVGGDVEMLSEGAFKSSGTNVNACIVSIDK